MALLLFSLSRKPKKTGKSYNAYVQHKNHKSNTITLANFCEAFNSRTTIFRHNILRQHYVNYYVSDDSGFAVEKPNKIKN